jgi:RNase_H superfamily
MIDGGATLARRLDRYRSAIRAQTRDAAAPPRDDLASRLATAVDGEIVRTSEGVIVRLDTPSRALPVDRDLLATLPGQPPPDVPLLCLDTETTGLATAAGTLAWLIGVGWWEADRFRQVQLLLPDNGEERCLLAALEATIPTCGWLVTYNGRGFDWPLLVARYRLARRAAPVHAGHLDLLPVVRRLFRHRMADARLRTAEAELLGLHRVGDVEGWEIPGRYLEFLRGGPAEPLVDIVRHNDQDVRSLARLLSLIANEYATPEARRTVPIGDLGGLATAYAREGRLEEALACYDVAILGPAHSPRPAPRLEPRGATGTTGPSEELPWWSPRVAADFGGPRPTPIEAGRPIRASTFASTWTPDRIAFERAHLLRRLKRWDEAVDAWTSLAAGPGRAAVVAAIELAKIREHRLRDPLGALHVAADALDMLDRRRRRGRPEPRLEADLLARSRRLRRRLAARDGRQPTSTAGTLATPARAR